jgi:PQQ-like domain/PQQ enzyme repeat
LRQQGSNSRVMWQQDLVELTQNMFNGQPVPTREIRLPWGASRHVPAGMNNGQTLGVAGPLVHRCVLVQRSRELTAFDPLSGEILWSRRGVESGSEVFGDDEVLVVAPPDGAKEADKATILRTMDGEELGTRTIPVANRRWSYCGRRCLSGRVAGDGKLTFVLSDPWKEQELVLGTFEAGVKPALVGDEAAAFLEPNGRFLMVALADGRKMIDEQLEPDAKLDNIVVQRSPDQFLLFVNHSATQSVDRPNQPLPQVLMSADGGLAPANGLVYAFDRATGKPLWPVPALVEGYHAVLNQGVDLPLIVLMKWSQSGGMAETGEGRSSILCLDRRTGRALHQKELTQPQANFFNCELSGNRERNTVTLAMPTESLTLRFTNDPVPPEPPYQAGLIAKRSLLGRNPADAALRALFPGRDGGGDDGN